MGATGLHVVNDSSKLMPLPITGSVGEQDFVKGASALDHEEFLLFSEDGAAVKAFRGDEHSVGVDSGTLDIVGDGYHNHPDAGWGGTLSMADINMFARSKMNSLTAIDKQGNTYTVRDNGSGNREGLQKWVNSKGKLLRKNFQASYRKQLKNLTTPLKSGPHKGMVKVQVQKKVDGKITTKTSYQKPMSIAQADKMARQISTGMYSRAYEKAIEKFGFSYVTGKSKNFKI